MTTVEKIVEHSVLGQWTYLYRVTETSDSGRYSPTTERQQIDPVSRLSISSASLDQVALIVLLIYWTLMESSRYQASFGKLAFGIKVVGERGERLSIPRAAARNLLKWLSAAVLFVGFLMAGWTRNKQALHDKIMRSHVLLTQ